MKENVILNSQRIRKISGSFCFIPHRFLRDGFFSSLGENELSLYFFLVLAGNYHGVSFYKDETIQKLLKIKPLEFEDARQGLLKKDLICFRPPFTQVLQLPEHPVNSAPSPHSIRTLRQQIEKGVE